MLQRCHTNTKKGEERGEDTEKERREGRGNRDTKNKCEKEEDGKKADPAVANLQSLRRLYDQLAKHREEVTFR